MVNVIWRNLVTAAFAYLYTYMTFILMAVAVSISPWIGIAVLLLYNLMYENHILVMAKMIEKVS